MRLFCSSVDHLTWIGRLVGTFFQVKDSTDSDQNWHLLILQIRIRLFFMSILVWVSTICYLKPTVLIPFSSKPRRTKNMTRIKILQTKRKDKEKKCFLKEKALILRYVGTLQTIFFIDSLTNKQSLTVLHHFHLKMDYFMQLWLIYQLYLHLQWTCCKVFFQTLTIMTMVAVYGVGTKFTIPQYDIWAMMLSLLCIRENIIRVNCKQNSLQTHTTST